MFSTTYFVLTYSIVTSLGVIESGNKSQIRFSHSLDGIHPNVPTLPATKPNYCISPSIKNLHGELFTIITNQRTTASSVFAFITTSADGFGKVINGGIFVGSIFPYKIAVLPFIYSVSYNQKRQLGYLWLLSFIVY